MYVVVVDDLLFENTFFGKQTYIHGNYTVVKL